MLRLVLLLALAICLGGCPADGVILAPDLSARAFDMAVPANLACTPHPAVCNPDCPKAYGNCFGGVGASCGACTQINEVCIFGEPVVQCFCDHKWHCSPLSFDATGCTEPDGGYVCN